MKKRFLILLVLIISGFFIFSNETSASAETCYMNCEYSHYTCSTSARTARDSCYVSNPYSYCDSQYETAKNQCDMALSGCVLGCGGSGNGGTPGGGGGRTRTPEEIACYNTYFACWNDPNSVNRQCETSLGETYTGELCCVIEYRQCIGN